jgi:ribonucleoside-diphosphate reductase alpha chain
MWSLINPRTGHTVKEVPARQLFSEICRCAWETGDPGLVFLDTINRDNPLASSLGKIEATNTCGEIALFPYESCNLGYLNLEKFLLTDALRGEGEMFDKIKLQEVVTTAVRLIDNTITASWFPIPAIQESVRANRRIGLGLTGWADCLSVCKIAYDSDEAIAMAGDLAACMRAYAEQASIALAQEKGAYPNSVYASAPLKRNVSLLALPPSGNNAIIFDSSFSIEPHFAMAYSERVMGGDTIHHRNKHLQSELQNCALDVEAIFVSIEKNHGSLQGIDMIPAQIRANFKTAHDIAPKWHIKMQAAFQQHIDNAVTKTVNLTQTASVQEVEEIYRTSWQLNCKGVTIYRDNARSEQAIEFGTNKAEAHGEQPQPNVCKSCDV